MRTFNIDSNNDFTVCKDGNLAIASDKEAIGVLCKQYAQSTRGEMIHSINLGIPYFKTVFGAQVNLYQFEAAFRARMREIEGVSQVLSFSAQLDNGVLKYDATIQTIYGEVQINNANL